MAWKCKKCGEEVLARVIATVGVEIPIDVSLKTMAGDGSFASYVIKEEIAEQADYIKKLIEKINDNDFDIDEHNVVNYECPWCEELGNLKDIAIWEED